MVDFTPTEIAPALPREQWEKVKTADLVVLAMARDDVPLEPGPVKGADRVLALANDALPADHPLKITREDVSMLYECVIRQQIGDNGTAWDRLEARRVALAAKLAALLPPEGR